MMLLNPNHQLQQQNRRSNHTDPSLICLKIKRLEYFCPLHKFLMQSDYFQNVVDNHHELDRQENRREPVQFVINLPQKT